MKKVPVSESPNCWDWMTLPPDSPITPVTACTIPGRSGQDRVTTSFASSVIGVSLARFIPTNEAWAGFAGDATGLRGGVTSCEARLRHCGRDGRPGGHDCCFTQVSRSQPARIGSVGAPRPDATLHAVELRRQGHPKQSLDIKADLTIDAAPFPLDSLLRCEAANPEQRSQHGHRRRCTRA